MITVLITGSTDGLGRALALRLARDRARLLLHGRDPDKLAALAAEVAKAGAPTPETLVADLSDLGQVARLAAEAPTRTDRLDVLVSNAGIGFGEPDGRERRVGADGHELRLTVNYLAGFLLTLDLLPLLRASAPSRVVNVSSLGQSPLDLDDLMFERGYDGVDAYRRSKLAQIMSATEFAARVPADEVTFTSLHPATFMPTKLVTLHGIAPVDTLEEGVAATYRLVTDPALRGVTGRFYNRTRESPVNDQAADHGVRAQLWRRSLRLVGREDVSIGPASRTHG
ncbi:3-oxoacyl-ACP reductase [Nocardiopsis sp. CNR-923]|uniref:SDR family NAD(P)-dependent oxidoreductase n=1 Tax=Nocardiopsis sp. CNR-923 TaxID=1904965 RepID=UPI00095E3D6B|nr:SDR family NAD(P)-dependent oxidoreductase [Nocardiopsis sp. CNR-923]OLT30608.1 3-oxoacyl-ACP reductase [Nocardiopsis sp. CNR-923]